MGKITVMIAECGTGKTLISLAALHIHSDGRPFTAIVMSTIVTRSDRWSSRPAAVLMWFVAEYKNRQMHSRVLGTQW
jgi:hypothetical protein